jgi:uncharacterized protein with NRDE domain
MLAANRDEFRQRPTQRMHYWHQPNMLAGKDLEAGGTWFGITADGRWAALTNYRDGRAGSHHGASRGQLCVDFLHQNQSAISFAEKVSRQHFAGYNLLLWDGIELIYYSNHTQAPPQALAPGIYGLSNAQLDSNWPKVEKAKAGMQNLLQQSPVDHQHLQAIMHDGQLAADHLLPDTGIALAWEQRLSACFIDAPAMDYGTRTCISLLQDRHGQIQIKERDFDQVPSSDQDFAFSLTT